MRILRASETLACPMKEANTAFPVSPSSDTTARAVSSGSVMTCGVSSTSTMSMESSPAITVRTSRYRSARASPMMSTGLTRLAVGGTLGAIFSRSAGETSASRMPSRSAVSAARMPGPPALVRMRSLPFFGTGRIEKAMVKSNSSSIDSARRIPACRNAAA